MSIIPLTPREVQLPNTLIGPLVAKYSGKFSEYMYYYPTQRDMHILMFPETPRGIRLWDECNIAYCLPDEVEPHWIELGNIRIIDTDIDSKTAHVDFKNTIRSIAARIQRLIRQKTILDLLVRENILTPNWEPTHEYIQILTPSEDVLVELVYPRTPDGAWYWENGSNPREIINTHTKDLGYIAILNKQRTSISKGIPNAIKFLIQEMNHAGYRMIRA